MRVSAWMFAGSLLALHATGCGAPQPKAPEAIVVEVDKSPRPSFLGKLELTDEQSKEIDQILAELYKDFAEYDRTRIILLEEIIREIRNNTLSSVTLEPLAKASVDAFETAYPSLQTALNRLHKILTPDQRKQLIELLSGKSDEKEKTEEERKAEREERLSRILDLSAGQKTQLYPALAMVALRHYGMISHFRAGIKEAKEAFVSENFDATQLSLANDLRLLEIAEAIYEALEASMKVLTPEQQQTLAALLDSHLR